MFRELHKKVIFKPPFENTDTFTWLVVDISLPKHVYMPKSLSRNLSKNKPNESSVNKVWTRLLGSASINFFDGSRHFKSFELIVLLMHDMTNESFKVAYIFPKSSPKGTICKSPPST